MKKRRSIHLKGWGVLIGSILMLLTLMTAYSYAELVGYWKFDENTGTTAYDSSGFNNTGTINNATWTSGKCGSGLSFGGNGYVLVPNSTSINAGTWTVICWVVSV